MLGIPVALIDVGTTGLRASRLWLGAAAFGHWGNQDPDACAAVVHRALDLGIVAFDTAAAYSNGESEVILGAALAGRRDDVVLATKFGYRPDAEPCSTAADVVRQCEASLRRLGTDRVDLYQVHRYDSAALPVDELLGGFDRLQRSGKVLHVGSSMLRADQLRDMAGAATRLGVRGVEIEQPPYSLFVRAIEGGILQACRDADVAVVGHAPLNGGWLSGKYRSGGRPPAGSRAESWPIRRERYDFERPEVARKLELLACLEEVASAARMPLTHLAIAFALSRPDVSGSVVGARTVQQLEALVVGLPERLHTDVLAAIDRIVPPGTTVDPEDAAGFTPRNAQVIDTAPALAVEPDDSYKKRARSTARTRGRS